MSNKNIKSILSMLFVFAVCATLVVADYTNIADAQNMSRMADEQTDMSGTYTGTINYPEGGLSAEATLTITGNQFTLSSGSANVSGTVYAVTTRGYTGVTMTFVEASASAPAVRVSMRARRMGTNGLMLTSAPGEKREFSFKTSGGGGGARVGRGNRNRNMRNRNNRNRRRGRGMNMRGNMNSGMGGNMNANMSGGSMNSNTPQ